MRVIVDENILYAREAFSQFGEVITLPGRAITHTTLNGVDALIVRSVTQVNEALLRGSSVRFVGTATIGTDHLDIDYLSSAGISWASAAGCNAQSVAEYISSVIADYCVRKNLSFTNLSIGIIGGGNIGRKVATVCNSWGMTVLLNDPPRAQREGSEAFCSLNDALGADIVTFHTPLSESGSFPSFHLLNTDTVELLKENSLLINASRGEVVSTEAVLTSVTKKNSEVVLDVWEREPNIAVELIPLVKYASAHTAGYSINGKVNGTVMMAEALAVATGNKNIFSAPPVVETPVPITGYRLLSPETIMNDILSTCTHLQADTDLMTNLLGLAEGKRGEYFDRLRKEYQHRFESSEFSLPASLHSAYPHLFTGFRFKIKNPD